MKKILSFIILSMVLVLTGCSSNTEIVKEQRLVCSQQTENVQADMIIDYKGNKLTYLGVKYTMDLSNNTEAERSVITKQDMCKTIKVSTEVSNLLNCKQNVEDKNLVITADIDISTMTDEDLRRYTSIEEVKTNFEEEKYTCTLTDK